MQVPLLDLTQQYSQFKDELLPDLASLCASQQFILGPKVAELEEKIAAYCGAAGALGVSSGSDALIVALMAEGIGQGDEVVTSSYTFFATAGAIARVGARPVFVDIDPRTFNLDVNKLEAALTPRTKAIIPVHLFGQPADLDPILKLAETRNLIVIEDACQAIGAEYKGKRVGALGDYGCLSFFPSKNLGAFGDAGMVLCRDQAKVERLRILRNHGMFPQYRHQIVGGNFRLDALQAVVLLHKLPLLDGWSSARQANFTFYNERLANTDGLITPWIAPETTRHIGNQYVIRLANGKRDKVMAYLKANGIGCAIYYPIALHCQECFQYLGYRPEDLPESLKAASETLALPVYPELTAEQKEYVASTLLQSLKQA
jgi:dTDP-4-amino-4,6-dideoxygalactose transaminase